MSYTQDQKRAVYVLRVPRAWNHQHIENAILNPEVLQVAPHWGSITLNTDCNFDVTWREAVGSPVIAGTATVTAGDLVETCQGVLDGKFHELDSFLNYFVANEIVHDTANPVAVDIVLQLAVLHEVAYPPHNITAGDPLTDG